GDLGQVLGARMAFGRCFGLLDRDVAEVFDHVAHRSHARVQVCDPQGGGTHVDAAAALPEIERRVDDGDMGLAHGLPRMPARCRAAHGRSLYSIRGNAIVSRTCSSPQIQATQRSIPMPKPACGTVPYFRRSIYQSKASFG